MKLTDCQQTVSLLYGLYRLYRPSNCFTPHSESIRRENIPSPLNDMQFTDCQQTVLLVYGLYRLYRPSNCFTPHSESIRRENILSPLNEMQFTDCQRTVSLVYGLYRPYRPSNCFTPHSECIKDIKHKNILSPLNEMQFTDCQRTDNHYYSLSDRRDRNVALTDCISASILDNPLLLRTFLLVLKTTSFIQSPYLYNTDTSIMQTLLSVYLVSLLRGWTVSQFTGVSLVIWPLSGSEAEVDLVLIQTF